MKKLVMIRHGQSKWNKENKFIGWTDVDLTKHAEAEAAHGNSLHGIVIYCLVNTALNNSYYTLMSFAKMGATELC